MRALNFVSVILFFTLLTWLVVHSLVFAWWLPLVALAGYMVADFGGGVVHWGADTYGHAVTKKSILWPFREHHLDPGAITRHDFITTNGNSCLVSLPMLAAAYAACNNHPPALAFFVFLTLFVTLTNQLHQWAHKPHFRIVRWLQERQLIINPKRHVAHHIDHSTGYALTSGWFNWFFEKTLFFRHLEKLIYYISGVRPRVDMDEIIANNR